jgi:hypothetical protein
MWEISRQSAHLPILYVVAPRTRRIDVIQSRSQWAIGATAKTTDSLRGAPGAMRSYSQSPRTAATPMQTNHVRIVRHDDARPAFRGQRLFQCGYESWPSSRSCCALPPREITISLHDIFICALPGSVHGAVLIACEIVGRRRPVGRSNSAAVERCHHYSAR